MSIRKLFSRDRVSTPAGQGAIAGVAEVLYVGLIAIFMTSTQLLFSAPDAFSVIFGIVSFLLLLVISVSVSAFLVFGWPIHYFLEKKYREATYAFMSTIGTMFVLFAVIFVAVAIISLM